MENNKANSNVDNSLKLLVKSSLVVFIGVFLSKILGYTYRVIIARYYAPEVYGLFSLVTMILGLIIAVSSLGLTDGLLRFIPQYRGKNENNKISYLLKITNRILLITSLSSAVLLFLLSDFIAVSIFHNPELSFLLKIASFFIPFAVLSGNFLLTIKSYEYTGAYSFIYNFIQNVVRVLVLILLIALGFKASSTIISFCLGFLAVLIASYIFCKYKIVELFVKSYLPQEDKLKSRKTFFSYSFPLLFFGIISMLFYWTDSFFLGYFKGVESVGFYNAAVPIAMILSITPELFMQLFSPMINRHYAIKNYDLIKQLSKQTGKWIFMTNLPIFILMFVFPGAAINLLFGSQYLVAESTLRILIFGPFIASIALISNSLISMAGKSKIILLDIIVVFIINTILNIILIPLPKVVYIDNSLGIVGAGIATVVSMILLNALFFLQAKKYLGIMPLKSKIINIFIIGIISATVLFYLKILYPVQNIFLIAGMVF